MDETSLERRVGCAEVRAYGRLFRYRRAGSGPPVLLLRAPAGSHLDADLCSCLTARLALIEPRMSDLHVDVARWLGCFMEGLGTSDAGILADPCFGDEAVALARLAPHQIARIAIVGVGTVGDESAADDPVADERAASDQATADGRTDLGGALVATRREAPVPLLVLDACSTDRGRLAAHLIEFLDGPGGGSRSA